MASARCPVVLNVPYSLEVIADCGVSFSKEKGDLLEIIKILDNDSELVSNYGKKAYERVRKCYTWARVISDYEALCKGLVGRREH